MPEGARPVAWLRIESHDAEDDVKSLPIGPRAKALVILERLSMVPRSQLRLKKTHVDGIWEKKSDLPEGGLRLLFVYGKTELWCIGGFVKSNDREGDRLLRRRYALIARVASRL